MPLQVTHSFKGVKRGLFNMIYFRVAVRKPLIRFLIRQIIYAILKYHWDQLERVSTEVQITQK